MLRCHNRVNVRDVFLFFLSISLFLWKPVLLLVFLVFLVGFRYRDNTKGSLFLLIFVISSVFGLINVTKLVESDLIEYYRLFLIIPTLSPIDYFFIYGKEPIFFLFNYVLFFISQGNWEVYVCFFTFVVYSLYLIGIYNYYKKMCLPYNYILLALLFGAFIPYVFSVSLHLMRQVFAAVLLINAMVLYSVANKRYKYWLLASIFSHSTVLIFLPLFFLGLKNKLTGKKFFLLLVLLMFALLMMVSVSGSLINFFGDESFLAYPFKRYIQGGSDLYDNDSSFEIGLYLVVLMLLLVYAYKYSSMGGLKNEYKINYFFLNSVLLYCFFMFAVIPSPQLQIRFFYYVYFFTPFIVPLAVKFFPINDQPVQIFSVVIMIVFFVFRLKYGAWLYDDYLVLLSNDFFSFLRL